VDLVEARAVGGRSAGAGRREQARRARRRPSLADAELRKGARDDDCEATERAGHGGEIGRTHEFLYRFLSNLPARSS